LHGFAGSFRGCPLALYASEVPPDAVEKAGRFPAGAEGGEGSPTSFAIRRKVLSHRVCGRIPGPQTWAGTSPWR
jgi:hypothetical protein